MAFRFSGQCDKNKGRGPLKQISVVKISLGCHSGRPQAATVAVSRPQRRWTGPGYW